MTKALVKEIHGLIATMQTTTSWAKLYAAKNEATLKLQKLYDYCEHRVLNGVTSLPGEKPRPLTNEELQNMHGLPVYIKNFGEWALVRVIPTDKRDVYELRAHGTCWDYNIVTQGMQCYTKEV